MPCKTPPMGPRLDAFLLEMLAPFASVPIAVFSAEMPSGPFRTTVAPTEAVAAPLHPNPVAPAKPTAWCRTPDSNTTFIAMLLVDSQWQFYRRGGRSRIDDLN